MGDEINTKVIDTIKFVEDTIKANDALLNELDKTLFRYLVFGNLGAVVLIIGFYRETVGSEKLNGLLDFELVIFATSFILACCGFFFRLLRARKKGEMLVNVFDAAFSMEQFGTPTTENFDEAQLILKKSKKSMATLDKYMKTEKLHYFLFLLPSGFGFLLAFILVIYKVTLF